jgi:hypothetical protein
MGNTAERNSSTTRNFQHCLQVGGGYLNKGPKVYMQDCGGGSRNTFDFKRVNFSGSQVFFGTTDYCLTNRGVKAHRSDPIKTLEIKERR